MPFETVVAVCRNINQSNLHDNLSPNDPIKAAIEEVNKRFENAEQSEADKESLKSLVIGKLPEDFKYNVRDGDLQGSESKFKARLSTNDMAENDMESWIAEFKAMKGIKMKIKTKKKPTSCYVMQNYHRCQHNTRRWSPSKDPQRRL